MREKMREGTSRSLAGSLLIAHPNMLDPNFRRSVLYISAHTATDGALGIILNRPLDKHVSDLVSEAPPPGLAEVPVFLGGPVGKNQLMFAAFEWESPNALKLNHNIALDEANERVNDDPGSIRAFVGYAGWTAGQLETEMKQNAWIVQQPDRAALTTKALPKLWFEIMKGLGPWYKLLAAAPDDPSLN